MYMDLVGMYLCPQLCMSLVLVDYVYLAEPHISLHEMFGSNGMTATCQYMAHDLSVIRTDCRNVA